MGGNHIVDSIVEIGHLAKGLPPFAFIADVPVRRFFRLEIRIAHGQDAHVGVVHIQFTDRRGLESFAPVGFEPVVVIEKIRHAQMRCRLAAEFTVLVVADGRDDDPLVAGQPFILDISGIGIDVFAIVAAFAKIDPFDEIAVIFRAIGQGMTAIDLMAVLGFNAPDGVGIGFSRFFCQGRIGQEPEFIHLAVECADHIIIFFILPRQAQAGIAPFRFQFGILQPDDTAPGTGIVFLVAPVAGQLIFIISQVEI